MHLLPKELQERQVPPEIQDHRGCLAVRDLLGRLDLLAPLVCLVLLDLLAPEVLVVGTVEIFCLVTGKRVRRERTDCQDVTVPPVNQDSQDL